MSHSFRRRGGGFGGLAKSGGDKIYVRTHPIKCIKPGFDTRTPPMEGIYYDLRLNFLVWRH